MPLLEGTDGVDKMSKSKGNYIGISEAPDSMFGKLMSISDTLMWRYFELLSFRSLDDISSLQQQIRDGGNPRDAKIRSEEHTSELQSLMRISYAVFCLKKKTLHHTKPLQPHQT